MDIDQGEREMEKGVVISDVLNREERERERVREENEKINQPRPDVPSRVPGSLKEDRPRLHMAEPSEVSEMGGLGEYFAYFGGEYEPKAVLTDEEKDEAVGRWKLKFPDEEIPYDLNNEATGMIEYEWIFQ